MASVHKRNRRAKRMLLLALVVCIMVGVLVCLLAALRWGGFLPAGSLGFFDRFLYLILPGSADHRPSWTVQRMAWVASHIQIFAIDSEARPPSDASKIPQFFDQLQPGTFDKYYAKACGYDPNTGSILDYWDNPVRLVSENPHKYKLISNGPNGKYEQGGEDDLVHEFDPLKFRKGRNLRERGQ